MAKLVFLLKRKPGTTKEQFREHYETSHVKLAEKYIGHLLTGYHRNYPTFATLNPSEQPAGSDVKPYDFQYDAVTEMRVREGRVAFVHPIYSDTKLALDVLG